MAEKYGYPVIKKQWKGTGSNPYMLIWAIYKKCILFIIIGAFLYFCSRLIKNRKE